MNGGIFMTLDELLKDKPDVLNTVNEAIKTSGAKFVDLSEGKYVDVDKYNNLNKKFEDLSKAENPFETKYNELLASSKNDLTNERKKLNDVVRKMAVDRAIEGLGIKDELTKRGIVSVIKMGDIKVGDDYSITGGLDEQIESIKTTYSSTFEKPTSVGTGNTVDNSLKTGSGLKTYSSLAEIKGLSQAEIDADIDNIMSQLPNLK